jgi:hypothetical protein
MIIDNIINLIQWSCGISIVFLIPVAIYLLATVDPTGPNSRDENGYKK